MSQTLQSSVLLHISAKGLPRLDLLSKSDPFVVVYEKPRPSDGGGASSSFWKEIGRTEVVMNNDSPSFSTGISLPFHFEEVQPLRFVVFDFDGSDSKNTTSTALTQHDYVGEFETTLGRIMGSKGATQNGRITLENNGGTNPTTTSTGAKTNANPKGADRGGITVMGTEVKGTQRDMLRITFTGSKLDKKDFFGKSDPYLVLVRPTSAEYEDWLLQKAQDEHVLQSTLGGGGGGMGGAAATVLPPLHAPDAIRTSTHIPGATPSEVAAMAAATQGGLGSRNVASGSVGGGTVSSTSTQTTFGAARQRLWTGPVLKNTLNPAWPEVDIPLFTLCNGDKDQIPFLFECYDWDRVGSHSLIGESTKCYTVSELLALGAASQHNALGSTSIQLFNPTKAAKYAGSSTKNVQREKAASGTISVIKASIYTNPTLLDYICGGCQMNLMVAVDFTGSNGDPRSVSSLHYMNPQYGAPLNAYGSAIVSVGNILQEYDSDKLFGAYLFGGSLDGATTTHCFPLSLNAAAPEVYGVQGLLHAYREAITRVQLSGPTLFAPLLRAAMQFASEGGTPTQHNQRYSTLLILTDGQMNDADETVDTIVEIANRGVALSIIIVGIGNADFSGSAMEMLDGDGPEGLKDSSGRRAVRDIVQFVPLNKFNGNGTALAAEVLGELPQQLVSYFVNKGFMPNPPLMAAPVPVAPPPMQYPPVQQQQQLAAAMGNMNLGAGGGGGGMMMMMQPTAPPPTTITGMYPPMYPPGVGDVSHPYIATSITTTTTTSGGGSGVYPPSH